MAFVAEDGTGMSTANGYVSTAFADGYHADRGHSAWSLQSDGVTAVTDQQKQEAIVRATDHIDRVFGSRFLGYKSTDAQALEWPRSEAFDRNNFLLSGVPILLQRATAEYALRALLYGVLTPDKPPVGPRQDLTAGADAPAYGSGYGQATLVREKVGPLETESRYAAAGTSEVRELEQYPAADRLLISLIQMKSTTLVRG